jgi:hypothetical protein
MANILVRPHHSGWLVLQRVANNQLVQAGVFQNRKEAIEFAKYLKGEEGRGK